MKAKILLVITYAIIMLTSCEKDYVAPPESQKVLFECYYINHAWGYQHVGFFIDHEGNIMEYSQMQEGETDWNFPDANGFISEEKMMENLQQTTRSERRIDNGTLKKYADKISSVTATGYTRYQNAADAGARVYVCYRYNEQTGVYTQIKLSEQGDWVGINNNKEAKEISKWLASLY